ncbi:MAG: purine-nucleoside phosphorylase [Verrucomicrobiales bacterium]|nr:purine-nucleoside phosphorylase [Verrucomicrobiales bacterium]
MSNTPKPDPGRSRRPVSPETAARRIRKGTPSAATVAILLGTGFSGVTAALRVEWESDYSSLPGFPSGGVEGHEGRLLLGRMEGVPVWVLSGRAHYYEGFTLSEATFPIRVMAALGVTDLLLTNAAGGIRPTFRPGDFMVLSDHINLLGENPLRGPSSPGLPRFVDLSRVYDPRLRNRLVRAARSAGARCHQGVYVAVSGPSFETPAEIRAFATLGADAVGMSTVPEAIVARQLGLRVAAVSAITNLAAGRGGSSSTLSHQAVLKSAKSRSRMAQQLVSRFVRDAFGKR